MSLQQLDVQATSRLGLEPILMPGTKNEYAYKGCVPTKVTEVAVDYQKHEKGEFAGMEVPVLRIEFVNHKTDPTMPERFLTFFVKPIGSKQLVEGTQDQYENRQPADIIDDNATMWKTIKHFLDSLSHSPNFRKIEAIKKEDHIKYFDLPEIDTPDNRRKKYEDFFTYIANFINGDGKDIKSMILDVKNEPIKMWVKVTPNYDKDPKRNAKWYTINRYIGKGVFEPLKESGTTLIPPRIISATPSELELNTGVRNPVTAAATQGAGVMSQGGANLDPSVRSLLEGGQK